jgi:MFS family permease
MIKQRLDTTLKYNIIVNVLDGAFFGFAIGFASFVTIIPLFVSSMTNSAILVGLIPAIHTVGWQLPQLLTANQVAHLRRLKPMVLWMTSQERIPFLALAAIAWFLPSLGKNVVLSSTFFLLIWQGLGAGFTANAWLSMIAKIIPADIRGTFLGVQAAAANLLASLGAILAGWILERGQYSSNYAYCFLIASLSLVISWGFLALTKEQDSPVTVPVDANRTFWKDILQILREQSGFRSFLVIRFLLSFATLAFAFYTVYAARIHGISAARIGLMTGVYMGTQIAANPILGWLGDRWGHRIVMEGGVIACIASAITAWWAPSPDWFFLVFILAGVSNVTVWTTGLAMVLEFGDESERPAYIGLANTLVAPSTILAPFLGGWLADRAGYPVTFLLSIACGILTIIVLLVMKRNTSQARSSEKLAEL